MSWDGLRGRLTPTIPEGEVVSALTAVPSTDSLVFDPGLSAGSLDIVNTSDRPGSFKIGTPTGPFTVASVTADQESDDGYYVPEGGTVTVNFSSSLLGPQSGSVLIESSSGDFVISLSSDALYLPFSLGSVAAYDFARMLFDGDFEDGEIMSSLPDKSGNENHGVAVGNVRFGTSQFPSGAGAHGFNSITHLTMSIATEEAMEAAQTGEVWTVSTHTSPAGSANGHIIDFRGISSQNDHHPLSNGELFTSFGSAQRLSGTWAADITPGRIVRWRQSAATNTLHVRDMTTGVDIINSPTAYANFSTGNRGIGGVTGGQYYGGSVGAVVVFDRFLNSTETAGLVEYLELAYGL